MTLNEKEKKKPAPSFEKGLKQLEELVKKMESGEIPLEEALKMYEEGIRLSRELERILTDAEKKIEILSKDGKIKPLEEEGAGIENEEDSTG
ncbi:MAG: exodeoxyribonuclease VII small subunit [Phycisphaerae bacterium]|nr:exodeoxyribonuclease VII small subunit [Phycisphaerae bacterium]